MQHYYVEHLYARTHMCGPVFVDVVVVVSVGSTNRTE